MALFGVCGIAIGGVERGLSVCCRDGGAPGGGPGGVPNDGVDCVSASRLEAALKEAGREGLLSVRGMK